MFYFENAIYITNTAVIKLSLLTQYMRIFKGGMMRWICKSLIIIIGLWGFTYGFMAWFPCMSFVQLHIIQTSTHRFQVSHRKHFTIRSIIPTPRAMGTGS